MDAVNYDPFSPETLADPAASYQELLEKCPVHFYEELLRQNSE